MKQGAGCLQHRYTGTNRSPNPRPANVIVARGAVLYLELCTCHNATVFTCCIQSDQRSSSLMTAAFAQKAMKICCQPEAKPANNQLQCFFLQRQKQHHLMLASNKHQTSCSHSNILIYIKGNLAFATECHGPMLVWHSHRSNHQQHSYGKKIACRLAKI